MWLGLENLRQHCTEDPAWAASPTACVWIPALLLTKGDFSKLLNLRREGFLEEVMSVSRNIWRSQQRGGDVRRMDSQGTIRGTKRALEIYKRDMLTGEARIQSSGDWSLNGQAGENWGFYPESNEDLLKGYKRENHMIRFTILEALLICPQKRPKLLWAPISTRESAES